MKKRESASENRSMENYRWKIYTVLFIILTGIILGLSLWRPLAGILFMLLLLLFIFVGQIIRAYCKQNNFSNNSDSSIACLKKKEIKNVQRLIRYATAVLAFLSLITTANGMRGLVFDSLWMANFASFGVQSILVVFSLLLCRFIVRVSVLKWPLYIKKLVSGIMVMFFCAFLMISSTFSFVYIANNAYKESWLDDSDTMIQNYLFEQAYGLKNENSRRMEEVFVEIQSTAEDSLIGMSEALKGQQDDELKADLLKEISELPYEDVEADKVAIDKAEWDNDFSRYSSHGEMLYRNYEEKFLADYKEVAEKYNNMISNIEKWKDTEETVVPETIYTESSSYIRDINMMQVEIENLVKEIEGWKTSRLNNDISTYRAKFKSESNVLLSKLEFLKKDLEEVNKIADQIQQNNVNGSEKEIDDLLSQIYLLGTEEGDESVNTLIENINDLAIKSKEHFDSEYIRTVILLKEKLILYDECLNLQEKLDQYIKTNLRKTYIINDDFSGSEDEETEEVGEKTEIDTSSLIEPEDKNVDSENVIDTKMVYIISEGEWREQRNKDFNEFYTYVKSLPDIENIVNLDKAGDIAEEEEYKKELLGESQKPYAATEVLEETSVLQRDLLGDITDIERAFNYFKYDFPVMAYFSAVMAVFFDLGAFFAGCFLYVTEFFMIKKDKMEKNEKME